MTRLVESIDRGIARAETAALAFVVGLMVLLAFVEVVLKLAGQGVPQLAQFNRYLVIWVGFLGGAVASYQARHINIDIVTRFVGGAAARRIVALIVNLAALLLTVMFLRVSLSYVGDMIDADKIAFRGSLFGVLVEFRDWWFSLVIPGGLALMAWHFLARLLYASAGYEPGDRAAKQPTADALAATEGGDR